AWDEVEKVVKTLPVPVHFAVGNHDMADRGLYESRFGRTYYSFRFNNDLFIVLDPNLDFWNISGEQLSFLKEVIERRGKVKHLFVFFHQVLWLSLDPYFRSLIPNSIAGRAQEVNFHNEVKPLFRDLGIPVYFFAGDVGAHPQRKAIYYHADGSLHYIASGMGGGLEDNFLKVRVLADGTVEIKVVALDGDDIHVMGFAKDHQAPPR
ncbi:MAG: hypothetical protein ABIK28_02275, partial [Planctomycetota bacterium]